MTEPTADGYLRQPTIHRDQIVFVCESDLWQVPAGGGMARRITAHQLDVHWPHFSPDGKVLAFSAMEEGAPEVYVMPAEGGMPRRLTHQGGSNQVCGFTPDGSRVLFHSIANQPFLKQPRLWSVPVEGGPEEPLPIGPGRRISWTSQGVVVSRREQEIARWKRYRGGTRGDLWVDMEGKGEYREILTDFPGNLGSPCLVQGRIWFVADHEGFGNVYSCRPDGSDLRRCTNHTRYYARALSTDGRRLVYQCGGELWLLDPATARSTHVPVDIRSTKPQLMRRFVSASRNLHDYALHPDGHSIAVTARGRIYAMGAWEGEVVQLGRADGVRYRLTRWMPDGNRLLTISDEGGEEALEFHGLPDDRGIIPDPVRLDGLDTGRIRGMAMSPDGRQLVLGNHRCEVIHVDLEQRHAKVLMQSHHDDVSQFSWSPDSRYVAFAATRELMSSQIFIADVTTGEVRAATRPGLNDSCPVFDPAGRYLYFLSARTFDPVYDDVRFDISFPKGTRPYAMVLSAADRSPFRQEKRSLHDSKTDAKKESRDEKSAAAATPAPAEPGREDVKNPTPVCIDFEGLDQRVVAFPVPVSRYKGIGCVKGRVFLLEQGVEGTLGKNWMADPPSVKLMSFDFDTAKAELFLDGVSGFVTGRDQKTLLVRLKDRLRMVKAQGKPESKETKPSRQSGYIDLERIKVAVQPQAEWRQMFREMWRLQRDHFWTTDLSQVDWPEVYERYLPVLDKVATRGEFSDLAWEVQGELGTSHAYEIGGDLKAPPPHANGKLGCRVEFRQGSWTVTDIPEGDSWDPAHCAPLSEPGVNIRPGDRILAVDGVQLSAQISPHSQLAGKAESDVALLVSDPSGEQVRRVVVRPHAHDLNLWYRDWVEKNRRQVHERTAGRFGYVHVPDMGPRGYSEFFRYFTHESFRDGLIVDVRYNGGGHVSQFLIEALMRRRVMYMVSHHMKPMPEPLYAVEGPIIALTNEHAGSDGDIFSHTFKYLKLGKLIGKRTWGGVIGIDGRQSLVDGTVVTQPEYSTWFDDVGWNVENYGTDPDLEVTITPQDWARGADPQLDAAIRTALEQLEQNPVRRPDFRDRPILKRPEDLP